MSIYDLNEARRRAMLKTYSSTSFRVNARIRGIVAHFRHYFLIYLVILIYIVIAVVDNSWNY